MTNTALLRRRIEECGLRMDEIAQTIGISTNSLHNKLNGKTQFLSKEIVVISRILEIEDVMEFFFWGEGE